MYVWAGKKLNGPPFRPIGPGPVPKWLRETCVQVCWVRPEKVKGKAHEACEPSLAHLTQFRGVCFVLPETHQRSASSAEKDRGGGSSPQLYVQMQVPHDLRPCSLFSPPFGTRGGVGRVLGRWLKSFGTTRLEDLVFYLSGRPRRPSDKLL